MGQRPCPTFRSVSIVSWSVPPYHAADLLERDAGDRDQVYCLELAFFPVADLTTMES